MIAHCVRIIARLARIIAPVAHDVARIFEKGLQFEGIGDIIKVCKIQLSQELAVDMIGAARLLQSKGEHHEKTTDGSFEIRDGLPCFLWNPSRGEHH